MLIRASSEVAQDFFLFSAGDSCHYVLRSDSGLALFDPGTSVQVAALKTELPKLGLNLADVTHVILTHLHAERCAGIPALKSIAPNFQIWAAPLVRTQLHDPKTVEELRQEDARISSGAPQPSQMPALEPHAFGLALSSQRSVSDGETFKFGNKELRVVGAPGHTLSSLAYSILPEKYLVVDEGFGYFNGRNLAGPGGDHALKLAAASLERLLDIEWAGLCLPYYGILTGSLVRRHLQAIIQNTSDLFNECKSAREQAVPESEIKQAIFDSFYNHPSQDAALQTGLKRSFEAVWRQVQNAA